MSPPSPPGDWRTQAADWFAYHDPVLEGLARQHPGVDRELLHDAFVQALLELCRKPEAFDPARGSIPAFLQGAAQRVLTSLLRSDLARRQREQKKGEHLVAQERSAARYILDKLADLELAQKARGEVARTDEERQVLRLWESGEENLGVYARALGLEGRPEAEQQAVVKRVRDRVLQRLRRLKDQFDPEGTQP